MKICGSSISRNNEKGKDSQMPVENSIDTLQQRLQWAFTMSEMYPYLCKKAD